MPDILDSTSFTFGFMAYGFTIHDINIDGFTPPTPPSATFRLVIAPSSLRRADTNTNWDNSQETISVLKPAMVAKPAAAAVQ